MFLASIIVGAYAIRPYEHHMYGRIAYALMPKTFPLQSLSQTRTRHHHVSRRTIRSPRPKHTSAPRTPHPHHQPTIGFASASGYRHATANAVVGVSSMAACPRHIPPPPFRLAPLPNRKHHALPKPTLPTEKRGLDRPNGTCDPQELEVTNSGSFLPKQRKIFILFLQLFVNYFSIKFNNWLINNTK